MNDAEELQSGRERKAQLYLQHPEESPVELIGVLPYLIHPPGRLSPTASWISYRDKTLLPLIQENPDAPTSQTIWHRRRRFWSGAPPFRRKTASGRRTSNHASPHVIRGASDIWGHKLWRYALAPRRHLLPGAMVLWPAGFRTSGVERSRFRPQDCLLGKKLPPQTSG
jgi:hypothetical protein